MSSPSTAIFYLNGVEVKRLHCNAGWFGFSGDWFKLLDRMAWDYSAQKQTNHDSPNEFEWDEVHAYNEKIKRENIRKITK